MDFIKDKLFSIAMGAYYSFYVKAIETHVRVFLILTILAIGRVQKASRLGIWGKVGNRSNHLLVVTLFNPIPTGGLDFAHHIIMSQPTFRPFRRS